MIFEKKNSVKILARSSIFPAFQAKLNFKVTPLDRGYFNVIFANEDGLLNNPGTCLFFFNISNFIIVFFSHIGIVMHIILIKMSHNSVLLINSPSKRGDVETLARSSIFSSS